jgi:NADPH-dependent 2,4-dienoyl-CoA reductase/sulfur reductase-like enzyme
MRRIVIVGAGAAGWSAFDALRRVGFTGDVVLIGEERHPPYRRPPLSKGYLSGDPEGVALDVDDPAAAQLRLGSAVTALDVERRRLLLTDEWLHFDGLVIATGSTPRPLPAHVEHAVAQQAVMTLRGLEDAARLRSALIGRPRVVVVGAGFLGTEVAATLRSLDVPVVLVDRNQTPLSRSLGVVLGTRVESQHRRHGVDLRLGRRVVALRGRDRLTGVHLDDGSLVPAELLIVALGAVPATEWLAGCGLAVSDGLEVDHDGLVAPGISAAGDVARWPYPVLGGRQYRFEHHTTAVEQGAAAARALLGLPPAAPMVPSFSSHLYDVRLHAVGLTGHDLDLAVVKDGPGDRFLAEYRRDGRLVGAATHGYLRELPAYRAELIANTAGRVRPGPVAP